jgi:glycosyltransferase involved in cell wall biosynthesis
MTVRVGLHFIRRRILRRAEAHGGHTAHSSVFRCATGFEAVGAASAGQDTRFDMWDETEPADDFVRRSDVLLGIPDIRLLNARERTGHRPPYLMLVMGDATRAIPFSMKIMERLQPDDTMVCTCSADREVLRLFLDLPAPGSVDLAPMPSDLSQFVPKGPLPAAAAEALSGFDPGRPVILSAERLKAAKGVHRVIPLAARLRDHGFDPVLVFLGATAGAARTDYQLALEHSVREQGLETSTVFLPFLDAAGLASVYARSTFAVSASTIYDNNFGYVPIESMVAATPPIVSDWGGYRDIVRDGVTGAHMPTTLHPDGAASVDWLPGATIAATLLADPDRYQQAARAARARVEDRYSIEASLRRYRAMAAAALDRGRDSLPPWRINDLGRTAIAAGWVDQTDNADRTGRVPRTARPPSADYHTIHQLIYSKYATRTEAAPAHEH